MHLASSIVCLCIITFSIGITQISAAASAIDANGLISGSRCVYDSDCEIKLDKFPKLTLQCVNKTCKCSYQGGFVPDFLYLEPENNECLMSKYGRCGKSLKQPVLEVGCSRGFQCLIDQRCRDPANADKVHDDVFSFKTDAKTTKCDFSPKLELKMENKACVCRVKSPEKRVWNMLSYEGGNFCSVSKFGPCGRNDDLEIGIGCHGAAGIKCEGGICIDPAHPKSRDGEPCSDTEHCFEGTICNLITQQCITRNSKKKEEACSVTEHCVEGLICNTNLKKCIVRNSIKDRQFCSVIDGKDECEPGHVCTTKRLKSELDDDDTSTMNKPKCRSKKALDSPEELCPEACQFGEICNIITKKCIGNFQSIDEGEICSVTAYKEIDKTICKHPLWCVQTKKQKEGTLTCELPEGEERPGSRGNSTSLVLFTFDIFKLNILISLILSVVIPRIINF